jgi:hypothetical protein
MTIRRSLQLPALCALTSLAAIAAAAPLSGDDPASAWSKATSSERASWAASAARVCESINCDAISIKACLDEALNPVPRFRMTIAEATAVCITLIASFDKQLGNKHPKPAGQGRAQPGAANR